ncbi:MAG TPA: tetratricopeptide repeat protein, partial [Lacunisphaera sp.]|nr:tetratricopeptide repeat protein [Lacunisphaera sp.]
GTGQALLRSHGELAAQVQQQMMELADETQKRIDRMIKEAIAEVGSEVQASNEDLHTASPEELEKHARAGDPVAQYLLGRAYAEGKGVEKNPAEAIKWFSLAADQGDLPAQDMMGALYFKGEGVEKDLAKARSYFQKSAESGSPMGAYSMGYIFLRGEGVEKDTKEAFRWLLQAANGGHGPSQYEVASLYWNGDGVERNLSEAYAWILVAVEGKVEGADKLKEFVNPRVNSDQVADGMMRSVELRRAIKAKNKAN